MSCVDYNMNVINGAIWIMPGGEIPPGCLCLKMRLTVRRIFLCHLLWPGEVFIKR